MFAKIFKIVALFAFAVIQISPAFSQISDKIDRIIDEEFEWLQEEARGATVSGVSKYEQRLMDVPATVSIIDLSNMSSQTKTNIPELLRIMPGVTVYRNHGDSPWYRVSLRALNDNFLSARTLVTIDGVPFFHPHGGGVDLSWLPIANIERIEVIKGTFSTLYGANAFGGVINIVTKKGKSKNKDDKTTHTSAGIQVFGRENIDNPSDEGIGFMGMAANGGQVGRLSYHLSADILTDEGYRQNWQVTPSFMGPQSRTGLFDDNLEQERERFSWHTNFADKISFSGFYTRDRKDIIGMNDDLDDQILNTSLSFSGDFSERYSYLFRVYYNRFKNVQEAADSFRFPEDNPFPGAHLVSQPFFYDLHAYTIGGEFQNDFRYANSLRLIFGADIRSDTSGLEVSYWDYGEIKPFGYPRNSVQDYGAYFQAEYSRDKFRISPGIRYDYDSKSGSFVSGKLGVVYLANESHSFYGVAGRGFRSPNFNERFVDLFGKKGTEDLEPEKTWQFELGSKNRFFQNQVQWDICGFYTIAEDYIDTDINRIYTNTDGVTVWGAETEGTWHILPHFRSVANFSLTIGEDDATGEDISLVPKHKWSAGLVYDDQQKWTANLMIRGESHKILGESLQSHIHEGSYQVLDVALSRKFVMNKVNWTATLFADNLFDRRYVESYPGAVSAEGGRVEGITLGFRAFTDF